MEALLSPKELAKILGIAEQTIFNRHSTGGDLPACIKIGRLLRFRPADVEAWLAKKQMPAFQSQQEPQPLRRPRGRPRKAEQSTLRYGR